MCIESKIEIAYKIVVLLYLTYIALYLWTLDISQDKLSYNVWNIATQLEIDLK